MHVLVHNHSSYPRVAKGDAATIIAQQEAAGCDIVTDGLGTWSDPFAVVIDEVVGVTAGESMPYFHTELEVRRPVVRGSLQRRKPLAVEAFASAARVAHKPVKAVLPGPYTLARCSDRSDGPYASLNALAAAFAEVLAEEVAVLEGAGARYIQIEEPAILSQPSDIRLLRDVLEPLWAARGRAQIVLATWGANTEPLYAQLNSAPADVLVVDLVSNPALDAVIASTGASKELALGVLDGRREGDPDVEMIVHRVLPLLKRYELETIHLCPTTGMRLHTAARAFAALQQLVAIGNLVRQAV